MSVTKEFAVKVDTELSEIYNKVWSINANIDIDIEHLKWYEKQNGTYDGAIVRIKAKIAKARESLIPLVAHRTELNAIYKSDPWNRAYLVVSSAGHVHKDFDCSTCFPSTRYAWLVEYSNDEEITIVEAAGELACTVCYPSAPAEVLNRPSRIVTADRIAKEKARAERQAKSDAKRAKEKANAPTASGEALVISYEDTKVVSWNPRIVEPCITKEYIATERTAVSEWFRYAQQAKGYTESLKNPLDYYGAPKLEKTIEYEKKSLEKALRITATIAEALAGKHGISIEEQVEILTKKLAKRKDY